MNDITLSSILFYADYLSLKEIGIPVTDNCKYFFIHQQPVNSAFIVGLEPFYDEHNEYFIQSKFELQKISDQYNEDGVLSFVNNIGMLQAGGMCDGERLIKYIHQYSDKREKKAAIKKYNDYINNIHYTITTINEDGDPQRTTCTRYVAHAEKMRNGSKISTGIRNDVESKQIHI